MRVVLFAAALLLAACTPPPPPGAAPAHAPWVLGELDVARIYAAVAYGESHSPPRQRVGLSRKRIKDWNLGEDGFLSDSVVSRLLDWGLFSVVCEDVERDPPECAPHGLMFSRPRRVNRDTVDVYMGPVRGIPMANWRVTRCRLAYVAGRWKRTECETTVVV